MIARILIVFLFCMSALADEPIKLTDFSGGLNTKAGILHVEPTQSLECTNWDLSRYIGALTIRNGSCAMVSDTIPGIEPMYGLYGYTSRDGEKYLFGITPRMSVDSADSHFVGLGELQISDAFGYSFDTANPVYEYIYTGARPTWATWKDMVFMANGRQKPIVWTKDAGGRDLVVQIPGEPRSYVMNDRPYWSASDSAGPNGSYRYLTRGFSLCSGTPSQKMPDPDMETWSDDSTLTYWTEYEDAGSGIFVSRDDVSEMTGTYCAKIENAGTLNAAYKHGLKDTIDVDTLTDYTFRAYVKFDTTAYTSAQLGSNFFEVYINSIPCIDAGGSDREPAYPVVTDRVKDTTNSWQTLELSFRTTLIDSLEIKFNYYADTGIVYLDSVNLFSVANASFEESHITQSIMSFNEKIMHKDFVFHTVDTLGDTTDTFWDDISVELYRTRSYTGTVDDLDTFFLISHISNLTKAELDTLKIIDSIPDDSLGGGNYTSYITYDKNRIGRNTDGSISGFRMGAPTYVGRNVSGSGISCVPDIDSAIAVVYAMAYRDTLTGFESEMGQNLYIWLDKYGVAYDGAEDDTNFTVGLPPLPGGQDNLIRVLYKTYAYRYTRDTTSGNVTNWIDTMQVYELSNEDRELHAPEDDNDVITAGGRWEQINTDTVYIPRNNLDTCLMEYYRLAIIFDSSTKTFLDDLPWDTLAHPSRQDIYSAGAPNDLNYISAFNDRLWGISKGSRLRWSQLDTASVWNVFKDIALNLDDGDQATAVVPMRDYIKVYKNNSQFAIYYEDGDYSRKWTVQGLGCIAPHTMTHYGNGLIYLSNQGVMHETGNVYKDKGSNYGVISTPIKNLLDAYTKDDHRNAYAYLNENLNKWILSYPDKDTSYVYDLLVGGWSIWTYAPDQVTYYDTTKTSYITPSKDLLFILDDDDQIFKADTTLTDNGTQIIARWKSGPLAKSSRNMQISDLGFWVDTTGKSFSYVLYNDMDTSSIDSVEVTPDGVHYKVGLSPNESNYFYLGITNLPDTTAGLEINEIDIYTKQGTEEIIH